MALFGFGKKKQDIIAAAAGLNFEEKPKKEEEAKGKGLSASKAFGPALKKMTDATTAKDAAALQELF